MAFASFTIKFKNYRSFIVPAELRIEPGLIALVGPNNGGKSNLLRLIYELRHIFGPMATRSNHLLCLTQLFGRGGGPVQFPGFTNLADPASAFTFYNQNPIEFEIIASALPAVRSDLPLVVTPSSILLRISLGSVQCALRYETKELEASEFKSVTGDLVTSPIMAGVTFDLGPYIEIFSLLNDSIYIGSFRNVINQGGTQTYYDLVIGNSLVERWNSYQGGIVVAHARGAASVVNELQRIFGFSRLELIATDDRANIKALIDGQPYLLTDLGSGISQFFIVMLNLELNRKRMVLIDEPELGLHPQLQTDFLAAIEKRAEVVLFTTHSLGLARTMGDIIYTIDRSGPNGSSKLREFIGLNSPMELLGELSYAGNYDLGYNAILLVEGPSEWKLFRLLLQRLGMSHRLTILSLGGSSLMSSKATHGLADIRRLSSRIYAIVDSERDRAAVRAIPERLAFQRNCARLGIECHLLELRCIESYFTDEAVKNVLGSGYTAVGPYDKAPSNWPKQGNWRIAAAMRNDEFMAPDLLAFLEWIVEREGEQIKDRR